MCRVKKRDNGAGAGFKKLETGAGAWLRSVRMVQVQD